MPSQPRAHLGFPLSFLQLLREAALCVHELLQLRLLQRGGLRSGGLFPVRLPQQLARVRRLLRRRVALLARLQDTSLRHSRALKIELPFPSE